MFQRIFRHNNSVFTAFIDVGHYVHTIEKYQMVVDRINNLPVSGHHIGQIVYFSYCGVNMVIIHEVYISSCLPIVCVHITTNIQAHASSL